MVLYAKLWPQTLSPKPEVEVFLDSTRNMSSILFGDTMVPIIE